MYTGLRISLDVETASEKEGIGVLPARGQLPEIDKIAADGHIRLGMSGGMQAPVADPEMDAGAGVADVDSDGFALDLPEAQDQCLPPQEMVKTAGNDGGMDSVRQYPQRQL